MSDMKTSYRYGVDHQSDGKGDENCGDAAQPGGATSGPREAVACRHAGGDECTTHRDEYEEDIASTGYGVDHCTDVQQPAGPSMKLQLGQRSIRSYFANIREDGKDMLGCHEQCV